MSMDAKSFSSRKFDYVVVGGGTAGLVVAARLSENPNISVGVIEAGQYIPNMPHINIPGLSGSMVMNDQVDWRFPSVPQADANRRVIVQPRGKVLGGSSALNFLVTGRATAAEYDAFESLGNKGWNWPEFLKYFKKSETFIYPPPEFTEKLQINADPQYHGSDGPLQSGYPKYVWGLRHPLVQSLEALGIPNNPEPASGHNAGSTFFTACIDQETVTRSYSTTAYYEPHAHRENLAILTGAQATRVILEQKNSTITATGVEFVSDGQQYIVTAAREVILSAGSIKSPQLLELSGIGNSDVLSKYGIQQIIDLPVGENFHCSIQDHAFVPTVFETRPEHDTLDTLRAPDEIKRQMELYQTKREGQLSAIPFTALSFIPLHSFLTAEEVALLKAKAADGLPTESNKQFDLLKAWLDDPKHAQAELLHSPSMIPGAADPSPGAKYQSLIAGGLHPLSRGSVHIQSADPLAVPAIDPAYFRNAVDLDIFVSTIKFIRKLAATEPLASTIVGEVVPGPEVQTDEQIADYCRNQLRSMFHPLGSASMLPKSAGGVVDHNLIVYGTTNLRVVDASIIPFELSAHPQATIYAIAEKAADLVKGSVLPRM